MVSSWAVQEFSVADLGDRRLNERAVVLSSALGQRPNLSIPAACGGRAEMEAAYRFFDNDKITFEKILAPHAEQTQLRMAGEKVVLLPQDTSEIDLTRPQQVVEGAGTLDGSRSGVLFHAMHAFTPEGVALGTPWATILNRQEVKGVHHQTRSERQRRPIEEKESMRWVEGFREARRIAEQLPQTQCVCIADSEGDIYELLAEERGPLHVLIRACQDRALLNEPGRYVRAALREAPCLETVELRVREREAKTAAEDRKRRKSRPARSAIAEVRAATVTLRPPWRSDRSLPAVMFNAVWVVEPNPPKDAEPVEWILLTTMPIDTLQDVRTIISYYSVRWCIELFFRTLKSGCRIEKRRFEHIDRVLPCLAMYLVVAWRTQFVCWMGRSAPDLPCDVIFEPAEWKSVWVTTHHTPPPAKPPPLRDMVRIIAQLGGYVVRAKTEPGAQTVWIGLQRMHDLATAWEAFGPDTRPEKP